MAETKKAKEDVFMLEAKVNESQRPLEAVQAKVERIDADVQKERLKKEDVGILDVFYLN